MASRRRITWIVFAVCAIAVIEGLGWVTWQTIKLGRAERQARAEAQSQELIRLALWRMDSELTPVIAQEAARPYFHYRSFYAAERAYTRMWQEIQPGELRVPSPLLESAAQYVRLHFQVEPDGTVTSPQAPTGNERDLAESAYVSGEFIVYAGELLDELAGILSPLADRKFAALDRPSQDEAATAPPPQRLEQSQEGFARSATEYTARQQAAQLALAPGEAGRRSRNTISTPEDRESARRDNALAENVLEADRDAQAREPEQILAKMQPARPVAEDVEIGSFEAAWMHNPRTNSQELIFRRAVRVNDEHMVQGFWLDWPAVERRLLGAAGDLFPEAALRPVRPGDPAPTAQLLASLPALLETGAMAPAPSPGLDANAATLAFTWLAVLGGIVAIGVVLRASMDLSDRRGRFVSAVTHELRTPLTTFCLYTDMLADGMVRDEDARREYLGTLRAESRHLAGIVENVLDYARLGQGPRRTRHDEPIDAAALVEHVRPALVRRAEQCGMRLEVDGDDLAGLRVAADPQTVERILINLVDNACKYAGDAPDKRVHLTARREGQLLHLHVRDHGPGIPRSERIRIFEAFHRAPRDAAGPRSGLGLGLALARGLARELGGDLEAISSRESGADMLLTLPLRADPAPYGPR